MKFKKTKVQTTIKYLLCYFNAPADARNKWV